MPIPMLLCGKYFARCFKLYVMRQMRYSAWRKPLNNASSYY
ncbi:hypothetical protein PAMC26577_33270 [Caballeronia sordidicola]|uniref:Uncharacterized protein n=1 Tax=Caballeronia sordidicola TaxID=196367 RepID=A0A242MBU0_CABSO|nr:hypothetical protein PAMC26577_33270 [Caballeronia sordidicola]